MTPAEQRAIAGGWPGVIRWAAPRAVAGTLAIAAILLALALLLPGRT